MEYTKFGNTGMDVSRICLGCMSFGDVLPGGHQWVLDEERSRPIIKRALELGINFFDTANVYAGGTSEQIIGRALKDYANRMKWSSLQRSGVVCIKVRMAQGCPGRPL